MSNRLANAPSPYLRQHADNPVDWYPWGEEALERARREDRPILLSVGYAACHWCHVMEAESFSDPGIAALMNASFVNIKVDREERPDIDSLYMQAVQQMTGRGGWPMTVFLLPDGSPFYGGTYFPPEPRHGLPSFRDLLTGIAEAYRARRPEVEESASGLLADLRRGLEINPPPGALTPAMLRNAYEQLARRFDTHHGGFGGAPKFPQPMILDFLLLYAAQTGERHALEMVEETLAAMARGGIHDQLGGGFHRYTIDSEWLVPHFEKMLYDNALLCRTYLRAYQATHREEFRTVAERILTYACREMRTPLGAFYSSQDADSEGEEGRFYLWTEAEIEQRLGAERAALVRELLGTTPTGNWEGRNILHRARSLAELSATSGRPVELLARELEESCALLYEARAERQWPAWDDKVLTGWNALMIGALADAARILGRSEYREAAERAADFLLEHLRQEGVLLRSWHDGVAHIEAFLEDYALLTDAFLSLYSATFDPRWIEEARGTADALIERFWSPEEGVFYDAPADHALLLRPRDLYDTATPSGTSAAAGALLRLADLVGEERYRTIASHTLHSLGEVATRIPQAFGNLLCALSHLLAPPSEVALVGEVDEAGMLAMLTTLNEIFLPFTSVALRRPEDPEAIGERIPLLAARAGIAGAPTAYVCRNYACREPVHTAAELRSQLQELITRGSGSPAPLA